MLPFEFIDVCTPLSHQTKNRRRLQEWKLLVRESAQLTWPATTSPTTGELRITVQYFHERSSSRIDGDNMLKPIQDALTGLLYSDDSQIIDSITHKRNIDGAFQVRGISAVLAEGFIRGDEFVYVRLDNVTDKTRILT